MERIWEPSRQAVFRHFFNEGHRKNMRFASTPGAEGETRQLRRRMARDYAKNKMKAAREQYEAEQRAKEKIRREAP